MPQHVKIVERAMSYSKSTRYCPCPTSYVRKAPMIGLSMRSCRGFFVDYISHQRTTQTSALEFVDHSISNDSKFDQE
jgi:hypothetical protein